jgi:hypothetical protein
MEPVIANQTRAVRRPLQRGQMVWCHFCGKLVKGDFRIGKQHGNHFIIANVYKRGKWQKVEYWEETCYQSAGEPHGPIIETGGKVRR